MRIGFKHKYVAAESEAQINAARARRGFGPSKFKAMDDFLMSQQIQDVANDAAADIASDATQAAVGRALKTGNYASSFETEESEPIVTGYGPRRTARVVNEAVDDTQSPPFAVGAAIEWGNEKNPRGERILGTAGMKYHTPRGIR